MEPNIQKTPHPVNLRICKVERVPHVKSEPIMKIVPIELTKHFCYAIVSTIGRIGLYDGYLNFLTSYYAIMSLEDTTRPEDDRSRRNKWVTDAIFCKDVAMFIVTNTARSIVIYDASGLKHLPCWLILSTPNILRCLSYKCCVEREDESVLFMGDSCGEVMSFTFHQPRKGFFRRKCVDGISPFYWNEIPGEKDYVFLQVHKVQKGIAVKYISYNEESKATLACGDDENGSVVVTYIISNKQSHVFKVITKASCFTLSEKLKLLITGSNDGSIRLWSTIKSSKPIAVFFGQHSSIVDVQFFDKQHLFLSYSKNKILKLWDNKEYTCVQTIKIKFPNFPMEDTSVKWSTKCIFCGPKMQENNNVENKNVLSITSTAEVECDKNVSEKGKEFIWAGLHILITYGNYVATLKEINPITKKNTFEKVEASPLPPPPLQNSVLIPSSWRIELVEKFVNDDAKVSQTTENLRCHQLMKHIDFVFDKEKFRTNSIEANLNCKIAKLEERKMEMQERVIRGVSYVALDLFEEIDLKLSENLALPSNQSATKDSRNEKESD